MRPFGRVPRWLRSAALRYTALQYSLQVTPAPIGPRRPQPTPITPPRSRDPAIRVPTSSRQVPSWSLRPLVPPPQAPARTRRRIGIVDLVTKNSRRSLYGRIMNANLASIMPQVLAVWCEEAGHEVHYVCYTGAEDLLREIPARRGAALHRRLHRGGAARLRAEQPLPAAGRDHRARRAPRPLLSRGCPALLRLRAGIHRPAGAGRGARGVRALPARWAGSWPPPASRPSCRAWRRGGSSWRRRWPSRR